MGFDVLDCKPRLALRWAMGWGVWVWNIKSAEGEIPERSNEGPERTLMP